MNSKSVAKFAACASKALLLWVTLSSFSPAVAKNGEGLTEAFSEESTEGNAEGFAERSCEGFAERNPVGTLSELNQIEYDKHLLPSNSISAGCGYSWLSNDILTANGESLGRTPTGFDVTLEYAHLWNLWNQPNANRRPFYMGFSINAVGSRTKVKIPRNGGNDANDVIMNYFVGAGYKMAYKTNKRFIWNMVLSLGYACTDDDFNTMDGFGVYAEMGCEYLLSKHWSAGVSFGGISTSYKQPAGWDNKYRFGIDHNGLRAKLGYYF